MNVENLKTELWPLDKIIPYPQNAKLHNVELIAEFIRQFKIDQPIAVDALPSNERKGTSSRLAQKRRKGRRLQEKMLRQNLKKGLKIL